VKGEVKWEARGKFRVAPGTSAVRPLKRRKRHAPARASCTLAGRKRVAGKQRARNTPTTQKNQQRAANLQVEDGRSQRNLSGRERERERERQEKGVRVGVGGDGGFLGGGCGDQIALERAEGLAHLPIIALGIRAVFRWKQRARFCCRRAAGEGGTGIGTSLGDGNCSGSDQSERATDGKRSIDLRAGQLSRTVSGSDACEEME